MGFSRIDLAIVIAYLTGITLLGAFFSRSQLTIRDYFLGGRDISWWAICLSIVATETSALTIIGTPALAFAGNLGFIQLALGFLLGRFLISFLLLPDYFSGQLYTAYQYIDQRFGVVTRRLAAGLFALSRILVDAVRLWAIAIVLQLLLPEIVRMFTGESVRVPEVTAVIIVMTLTLTYTYLGGMKAVIWTDVLQFSIFVAGGLAALWSLLLRIPGGWDTVMAEAGPKFVVFDFSLAWDENYTFWAGILGGTFLTFASHGTDQLMVQRLLAARGLRDSQRALITSGFLSFAQFFLFLIVGLLLYVFYAHVPSGEVIDTPDKAFPLYMVGHLPPGLGGLLVAAVLAAAMSTLSSTLNSLSASTIVDFYEPLRKGKPSPAQLLRYSRWVTVIWAVIITGLATLASEWGLVFEVGLAIASFTYGSLLGLFLLGRFASWTTPTGAATGMLIGLVALLAVKFFTPLAWIWYVPVGTLVTFVAGSGLSLVNASSLVEARRRDDHTR